MSLQCSINIDTDNAFAGIFVPGLNVGGKLVINAREPTIVTSIDISLITVHTVVYKCYDELCQKRHVSILTLNEIFTDGGNERGRILLSGTCWFDFLLKLPSSCNVPTFNTLEGITDFNYYVKATIRGPSFSVYALKEPFAVTIPTVARHPDFSQKCVCLNKTSFLLYDERVSLSVLQSELESPSLLRPFRMFEFQLPDFSGWTSDGSVISKVAVYAKACLDRANLFVGHPLPLSLSFGSTPDMLRLGNTSVVLLQYVKVELKSKISLKVDTFYETTELLSTDQMIELFSFTPQNKTLVLTPECSDDFSIGSFQSIAPLGCQIEPVVFEPFKIPNYMSPSFISDTLEQQYDLHVTVGISAEEIDTSLDPEDNPEINISSFIFENVCVLSAIYSAS